MADRSGRLQWQPDKRRLVVLAEGDRPRTVKRDRMLVPELRARADHDLHDLDVDYDWTNGQPANIRPRGAPAPERPARPRPAPEQRVSPTEFANPYLFIPARPRTAAGNSPGALGDRRPDGHHRIRPDRWSGRIAVTLTAETPLLLLDTAAQQTAANGHKTFPVLLRHGLPHLAPTSVKGMLRAAYEAVTNSRFGVFTGHGDRLGYRMTTRDGLAMVPARISDDGSEVVLLPGDTPLGRQGDKAFPLHAAWLPQYTAKRPTPADYQGRRRYPDGQLPAHGDEVEADVELQHAKKGFLYWTVRSLRRVTPATPAPAAAPHPEGAGFAPGTRKTIRGWVFITNQNVGNKHDERVFFASRQAAVHHLLTDPLRAEWQNLIRDYRAANRRCDVLERRLPGQGTAPAQQFIKDEPGQTAWSPHQYEDSYLSLEPGALCYATVDHVTHGTRVTGLYPVAIARALFDAPPGRLLHDSLRPATALHQLSPADRVFGWVADSGGGAYRGQLRIGPVTCDTPTEQAVETFPDPGVPLAVLSAPSPQQGRFYLAARQDTPHLPLKAGEPKRNWYTPGQSLRGRKAYWHHAGLPDGYWTNPAEDRTQTPSPDGRYQEYRRPDSDRVRDDQNRSVLGWIRPGTVFRFTMDVHNLTDTELGALTWLLTLPDGHFHRLGHGKPLGFGSVRLDLDPSRTDLRTTGAWRSHYRNLTPQPPAPATETPTELARRLVETFAARTHPPHALDAFLTAARGPDKLAVHYPRTRPDDAADTHAPPPDPQGRSYTWFTDNERTGRDRQPRSLPHWHSPGLPYDPRSAPAPEQPRSGGRPRPRQQGRRR